MSVIYPAGMAILLLGSGCTARMVQHGWAVQTGPTDSVNNPAYQAPVATKDAQGSIVFEFDAAQCRLNGLGNNYSDSQPRHLRITNRISAVHLQPVTNNPFLGRGSLFPMATNISRFSITGQRLPLIKLQMSPSGHWIYPDHECVFKQGSWYWYVPPREAGDIPRLADLTPITEHVPPQQRVWRVLVTPIYFLGDVICDPIIALLLATGDGRNAL